MYMSYNRALVTVRHRSSLQQHSCEYYDAISYDTSHAQPSDKVWNQAR
jgi:hypothetical protein